MENANDIIYERIASGKPFMLARLGETEVRSIADAVDYMYDEAMKRDFNVAILGCGAYGFPLAARIKQAGKQAIHLGGATQILFGIKGSRWDNNPFISKLYNSNWIRPNESEKPTNSGSVENSCYW